ncbi:ROK family transcriptional regulator [Amorphus coralli]|uniref:ROK family transcriptional regulator n=1 Tax=Amorphus coralli TaxID=340680 RepID=UPI000A06C8CE|nr:ROK family transcriptional regulator [Amorphus coralli]
MRGGDTSGLRAYNERLIMDALLRAGALSKAELARETGLSGQAASVIVNRLLEEGLLIKRDKIRGQIGQPSTPIAPNPDGAFSLGVKIGRRSTEAILVNLVGEVIEASVESYEAPLPDLTIGSAIRQAGRLLDNAAPETRSRVVGLGIAMPGEIYAWSKELGLEPGALDGWRNADVAGALEEATGLDTALQNDATAACAAEMISGAAITSPSALYIYLGTFIGGGIVIDGKLYPGAQWNAGAVGSMPVGDFRPGHQPEQLIHSASVIKLEHALADAGIDPSAALAGEAGDGATPLFEAWADAAIPDLSRAVVSALSIIDFETVVVDGLLPPPWRDAIAERLAGALAGFNRAGLAPTRVRTGSIGPMARVLGAAMLPLHERFSPDPGLLVRIAADGGTRARAADD